jgi:hypothetical protein
MGVPSLVMDTAPPGAQTAPAVTGRKAVVLVAVVGGPTRLEGVVTPGWGVVVATVVGLVLAVAGRAAAAVVVVWAAANDDEDVDLPAFELVEHPDATTTRTIATRSVHLRAEDLMAMRPMFPAQCSIQPKVSPPTAESHGAEGEYAGAHA